MTSTEETPAVWRDSEPPRRSRYDWPEITKTLRKKPEKWLLIAEQVPRSVHGAVKKGRIALLRDDAKWAYEIRTRNTKGSTADIWMMAHRKGTN